MFRSKLSFLRPAVLAMAAVALFSGESQAQRFIYFGFPSGPFGGPFGSPIGDGPFGGGGYGYSPGGGYYSPAFSPSSFYSAPSSSWYSSSSYFLPVLSSTSMDLTTKSPNTNEKAAIEVKVPANAQVWFDDAKTAQKGTDRYFSTPALPRGKSYVYEVRATWTDGEGRSVEQTKQVTVEPGKWSVVNFLSGS